MSNIVVDYLYRNSNTYKNKQQTYVISILRLQKNIN